MVNRILKILKEENLTASQFADLIDVQRSSMSHILSGRNNPSLDFVNKLLKAFPLIDTDWLMSGTGEMYKSEIPIKEDKITIKPLQAKNQGADLFDLFDHVEPNVENKGEIPTEVEKRDILNFENIIVKSEEAPIYGVNINKSDNYVDKTDVKTSLESNIQAEPVQSTVKIDSPSVNNNLDPEKKVEQIVIFYTDKTFSVYRPE